MKILIDESLPKYLKQPLQSHEVFTVQEMGWTGLKNGILLNKASGEFDVLLTADKNLRYQQNLSGLTLSIIVLPSNRLSVVRSLIEQLQTVLPSLKPGEVVELS